MATTQTTQKQAYQTPEIVNLGLAGELTNGMGGTSKDMDGWTIPVVVPGDSDEIDIPDVF
jgi:hypothetical protein